MNRRYAVILIQNPEKDSEYLMGTRRDNKKFNFPAGGINYGEDPKIGAIREVKEETGFDAKNLKLVNMSIKNNREIPVLIYVYTAEISGTPSLKNDPDKEFKSLLWINPFQISLVDLHIPYKQNLGLESLIKLLKK